MRIWHISDTHGYHDLLQVPEDIDMVIFSGDAGNVRSPFINEHEVRSFLLWYSNLNIPLKLMIAGNHDSSIEAKLIKSKDILRDYSIMYLEDEMIEIEGLRIWGSPCTPTFNNWSFNRDRSKLNEIWQRVPDDINIMITHGPPKGILDLSEDRDSNLDLCGDSALLKRILTIKPKLHLFGHIHNFKNHINAGIMKLSIQDTIFSNGSVVTDNKFGILSSNGNILEI